MGIAHVDTANHEHTGRLQQLQHNTNSSTRHGTEPSQPKRETLRARCAATACKQQQRKSTAARPSLNEDEPSQQEHTGGKKHAPTFYTFQRHSLQLLFFSDHTAQHSNNNMHTQYAQATYLRTIRTHTRITQLATAHATYNSKT
jgi:hypothetical protein